MSMLSGPPSAAPTREGATISRVAIATTMERDRQRKLELAEGAGDLLISVASAGPVLKPLISKAKAVSRSTITGHPVYSLGCPEVLRW